MTRGNIANVEHYQVGANGIAVDFSTMTAAVDALITASGGASVTGTNFADHIDGGAGADTIHAGDGDDTLVVKAGDAPANGAGETYDGGAATDTLQITGSSGVDLRAATLTSIERVGFATSAATTFTFGAAQLGGATTVDAGGRWRRAGQYGRGGGVQRRHDRPLRLDLHQLDGRHRPRHHPGLDGRRHHHRHQPERRGQTPATP